MIQGRKTESQGITREIIIQAGQATLDGTLTLPEGARGIILFAHGSGSSRHSPRNRYVASVLQARRMGTLLFDLLTHREELLDERTAELRFDIAFLAERLRDATQFILRDPNIRRLYVGYFGASTGAAAALVAAAELPDTISAVVSRGGRPDLAGTALDSVEAPTLLIVGGNDDVVIELNRQALQKLAAPQKKLVIVPGATHLFEELGTLEEVARLAGEWFARYCSPAVQSSVYVGRVPAQHNGA
jgi:pimeloyl-ACP methyl ester carboxylesterase